VGLRVEKAIGGWRNNTRNCVIFTSTKYYLRNETKEKWTAETRITHGAGYKCYGILVGRLEGNGLLGRTRRRRNRISEEMFYEGVS
jgi:hypothetical protein